MTPTVVVNPYVGDLWVSVPYKADMDDLGSRIRVAREAVGLSQQAVADHFKINRVSVAQWEGNTTRPDQGKLIPLAELLKVEVKWLLDKDGIGPVISAVGSTNRRKRDDPGPTIVPGEALVGKPDFPIYAAAEGGQGHLVVTFEPVQWVRRPAILEGVRNAYGILVRGDSMVPAFRQGDMALIHPHLPFDRGTDVVLYDAPPDGQVEAMIKHLLGWTEKSWKLEQYNPPKTFSVDRVDWPECHRVVGKYNSR